MNNAVRNWAGIVGVCLVFVLGMIAGCSLTINIERHRAAELFASGRLGNTLVERVSRRLATRLGCDPRQREELRLILLDTQHDLRTARQQIAPQIRDIYGTMAVRVKGILREDQVRTFDRLIAQMRERRGIAEDTTTPAHSGASAPAPKATPADVAPR